MTQYEWLSRGFEYLVAVIDWYLRKWYSRKLLAWRLSNTLYGILCGLLETSDTGLWSAGDNQYGPKAVSSTVCCLLMFSRHTASPSAWTGEDGRGRALDHIFVARLWSSVKHEGLYLKGYATMPELLLGLTE